MNTARRYGVDLENAEQVRKLALTLFDQTRRMHGLSKDCREWIAAAAMLVRSGNVHQSRWAASPCLLRDLTLRIVWFYSVAEKNHCDGGAIPGQFQTAIS